MTLTPEEKKQHQLEAQRRYRAKLGRYLESQKRAQYKYLNKIREMNGLKPIVSREHEKL